MPNRQLTLPGGSPSTLSPQANHTALPVNDLDDIIPIQAGYSCFYGMLEKCEPGTYRNQDYQSIEQCFNCPKGRYREQQGGRHIDSCEKCPVGRYVNETGTVGILLIRMVENESDGAWKIQ